MAQNYTVTLMIQEIENGYLFSGHLTSIDGPVEISTGICNKFFVQNLSDFQLSKFIEKKL